MNDGTTCTLSSEQNEGADDDWGTGLGLRRGHLAADPA